MAAAGRQNPVTNQGSNWAGLPLVFKQGKEGASFTEQLLDRMLCSGGCKQIKDEQKQLHKGNQKIVGHKIPAIKCKLGNKWLQRKVTNRKSGTFCIREE